MVVSMVAAIPSCRWEKEQPVKPQADGDCTPPPPEPAHGGPLRWYTDGDAAFRCARRLSRPLVLELWAPWCHTCLSMQQTVLLNPRLRAYRDRFVWLMLDTDRPENAEVLARFPPVAWPTLFATDPEGESIVARLVGAASVEELLAFLDGALATSGRQASPVLDLVRSAHEAEAKSDWAQAADLYAEALRQAPADFGPRAELLVSRIRALHRAGNTEACIRLAEEHGTETGRTASAADFAFYANACAQRVKAPERTGPVLLRMAAHVLAAVDDEAAPLSVDDRSDALRILRLIALARGDPAEARALAERQRSLLDRALAEAESPLAGMTYNWPAAEVYAFLGESEALIPVLERSVSSLPEEYDPPYRLAWLLLQSGRAEEALGHAEAALARVYGPRKAEVYALLANIHAARGDPDKARAARASALTTLEAIPKGMVTEDRLRAARAALKADARP